MNRGVGISFCAYPRLFILLIVHGNCSGAGGLKEIDARKKPFNAKLMLEFKCLAESGKVWIHEAISVLVNELRAKVPVSCRGFHRTRPEPFHHSS
jgi:hypothetical protein